MNAITGVLVGLFLTLVPTAAAADTTSSPAPILRFTAIPDHNATELKQKFDPVAQHLSRELEIKVEYVPAADYQASVEMFKNGDVLLAWFGGLTGVQAREAIPGARAIVQGEEDPQYYSFFIAHESTGLERSEDFPTAISALPFSFGSESSTSGRLMPEHFIREHTGKSPKEFFSEPFGFSGSHPKTAEFVADGSKIKAGVLNYKTYDAMVADGRIDPKVCRIIWKTPYYADYNFTAHPKIDEVFGAGTIDKVQATLTAISDESLLAAFQRKSLIKTTNAEFDGIKRVAYNLGMIR
jgi:phosphonate transport system substrate-binding protein